MYHRIIITLLLSISFTTINGQSKFDFYFGVGGNHYKFSRNLDLNPQYSEYYSDFSFTLNSLIDFNYKRFFLRSGLIYAQMEHERYSGIASSKILQVPINGGVRLWRFKLYSGLDLYFNSNTPVIFANGDLEACDCGFNSRSYSTPLGVEYSFGNKLSIGARYSMKNQFNTIYDHETSRLRTRTQNYYINFQF